MDMFESLKAIANSAVANTIKDDIKMIDVNELSEAPDNFFSIDRIEEFADTIQGQGGVKETLIVRQLEAGRYEVVSGHRRLAAVKYLLEKGEKVSHFLPCLVQNYENDDDRRLDLVLMNVSARQMDDFELWRSYEIIDDILYRKKESGEKFGRIRDKIAEILGISKTQAGKLQNIDNHAISAVKEAIEKGELSICTANEIAKLDNKEQEEIITRNELNNIKHKDVIQKKGVTCDTKSVPNKENNSNNAMKNPSVSENAFENNQIQKKGVTCDTKSVPDKENNSNNTIKNSSVSESTFENNQIQKKGVTNDTKSVPNKENNSNKSIKKSDEISDEDLAEMDKEVHIKLSNYIHEHYFEIDDAINEIIGITDNMELIDLLGDFQNILFKIKEIEGEKMRKGCRI